MRELRAFLGIAGWLREYVPGFAEIATPLTNLIDNKKRTFRWTATEQDAFERLKDALANHTELHRPSPDLQFCLQTDASAVGMGAVLFQQAPDGCRRIIACASAKFTKTEKKYHVNEQETLATIWGIKKFRQFLEDVPFVLYTDSRALLWLDRYKDEKSKLTRWALMLQAYNFNVVHVPGRCNELPDFLSRNPQEEENRSEEPEEVDERMYPTAYVLEEELAEQERPLFEQVKEEQRENRAARLDKLRLRRAQEEGPQTPEEARAAEKYVVEDDLIWRKKGETRRLLVPDHMRGRVMQEHHDGPLAAHPGRSETLLAIRRVYDWPGMTKHVKRYVKSCHICSATKTSRQEAAPLRPRRPEAPWRVVSMDILGPYPRTRRKNLYIVVLVDTFSKWVEAKATTDAKQGTVLDVLEEVAARWGFPESVITDNGPAFRGRRWKQRLSKLHITHYTAPAFHQRANPVERRVQELKKILRAKQTAENRWDEKLHEALFTLRNRNNASTGQAPAEILVGAPLLAPGEWTVPAIVQPPPDRTIEARRERIHRAARRQVVYERKIFPEHREAAIQFEPRDMVMARENRHLTNPFHASWSGPHEVVERHGDNTYTIERDGLHLKIHVDDLRPAPPARE